MSRGSGVAMEWPWGGDGVSRRSGVAMEWPGGLRWPGVARDYLRFLWRRLAAPRRWASGGSSVRMAAFLTSLSIIMYV